MRVLIWLSFDLGVRGDFEGMYQFLGEHEAKECGDSMGAFWFEYKKDLLAELTKKLKDTVEFDKRSRVYVIYPKEHRHVGKFIIGVRRSPPWASYIPSQDQEEDVGE
jgi:hypothetical protein